MSKTLVVCYTLDGKLVKTYPSAKYAASSLKMHPRSIDKCIRGDTLTAKGYLWRRMDIDNVKPSIEPYQKKILTRSVKPIAKIDEKGDIIEVYPSLKNAAKNNSIDPHTLRDIINKKYNFSGKTRFRYLNDIEIDKYGFDKGREINIQTNPVIQLSKEGEYIRSYNSIREATLAVGKKATNRGIYLCLEGKYNTAFGYMWKYKDKANVIRERTYIVQLKDNIEINRFISVKEASQKTNISIPNINNCLRGKQKTAGGYNWKRMLHRFC